MSYTTMWDLTESNVAALIASSYLLFDVGMLTLNQYILLDPFLLCFMTASVMGMVKVSKYTHQQRTFSAGWWWWLLFTGSMLASTISVKFVGLFVVLLVGLHTINDLWIELGDLSKPVVRLLFFVFCFFSFSFDFIGAQYLLCMNCVIRLYFCFCRVVHFQMEIVKQFIGRAITLIVWPILVYMGFFYIHLQVLNRSGNGDGFYSSAFQSQLIGNSLYNATMPRQVAYGAVLTLKNFKTGGGYLHSHYHLYPKGMGARQQQVRFTTTFRRI